MRLVMVALVALLLPGRPAAANSRDGAPFADPEPPICATALAVAVVPGALVHGLGHRVAGERRTAARLLYLEGIGLSAILAGGLSVGLTGASRYSWPGIPLIVGGVGAMLAGWFSDIYGSAGGARRGARPRLRLPPAELRLEYAYVRDPQFEYGSFAVLSADLWWRTVRASPAAWLALDDANRRLRFQLAHRLRGPGRSRRAADGSHLEIATAFVHHRHGSERFSVATAEVAVAGRLDLARIGRTLRGAYAELAVGLALDRIAYDGVAADTTTQLLGRTAWGMYLGAPGRRHGEVQLYYDHRRDDYAGGLALGGGFLGYFGAAAFLYLRGGWGVTAAGELGSANLVRVGLVRRLGDPS